MGSWHVATNPTFILSKQDIGSSWLYFFMIFIYPHGILCRSPLPTPCWMSAILQTHTHNHKCRFAFCCCGGVGNTWDLLVNIQETLLHSMWKIGFSTECIAIFSPNQSLFIQQVSWCRICTSLPGEKFMWFSAHIQMAPEWIRCSDSNWVSTFRSVWECCLIPGREVEHHRFQAAVSVILAKFYAGLKIYII